MGHLASQFEGMLSRLEAWKAADKKNWRTLLVLGAVCYATLRNETQVSGS